MALNVPLRTTDEPGKYCGRKWGIVLQVFTIMMCGFPIGGLHDPRDSLIALSQLTSPSPLHWLTQQQPFTLGADTMLDSLVELPSRASYSLGDAYAPLSGWTYPIMINSTCMCTSFLQRLSHVYFQPSHIHCIVMLDIIPSIKNRSVLV